MRALTVVLLAVLSGCAGRKVPPPPDPLVATRRPAPLLQLRYEYPHPTEENKIVIGHCTGFGVDFRNSSRYILTAGHNVIGMSGILIGELQVKADGFETRAFLVKVDPLNDVALLKAVENLPTVHRLAELKPVELLVSRKGQLEWLESPVERMTLSVDIEEGDSGSPVLDPESHEVTGMLVQRIGPKGSGLMQGRFLTSHRLRVFLDSIPQEEKKP